MAQRSASESRLRVLHVDDDEAFADLTEAHFERLDADIGHETVRTVAAAQRRCRGDSFDAVVCDYDLPDGTGIDLLERVRETDPNLPFVLFTGKGSEEVASEAISAGVTDYLQKGSGVEQYELLANQIRNAVTRYRAERRATEQERILAVIRDLNQVLVRASTRAEIDDTVCEIIAGSGPDRKSVV